MRYVTRLARLVRELYCQTTYTMHRQICNFDFLTSVPVNIRMHGGTNRLKGAHSEAFWKIAGPQGSEKSGGV
jgi:hypothetical protein